MDRLRVLIARALLACSLVMVFMPARAALAFNESGTVEPSRTACVVCHAGNYSTGPHGGYLTTTAKCGNCHLIHHAGATSRMLLPAATTQATCETCHDGTGGSGVYGTLAARGVPAVSRHRIDTTRSIPGGASDGYSRIGTFTGESRNLSCGDCHSPHGTSVVTSYTGDRARNSTDTTSFTSTRLLRRSPGGATSTVTLYGTDWCVKCHVGRASGTRLVHNHVVDSFVTTTTPFDYQRVALITTETAQTTTMGAMGRTNRGYLMPYPRTSDQTGHGPICQQCHEDSRSIGSSGAVQYFVITQPDGRTSSDNPRFQNFPHEAENTNFLIEVGEDLCTNCHPSGSGMP